MKKIIFTLGIFAMFCLSFTCCHKPTNEPEEEKTTTPEQVDLGLPSGLKWASFNVGAKSENGYGKYFEWGCEATEKEGWDTYCHGQKNAIIKYCTNEEYGTVDNLSTLELDDDAAHKAYGGKWRMPTKEEALELWNNCSLTWDSIGTTYGYRFTGPNGKSIFLPANGWIDEDGGMHTVNEDGLYWTSTLDVQNNNSAWGLITRKEKGKAGVLTGNENRHFARAIRAVHP